MKKKQYFIGFQLVNLVFQLLLIPLLYKNLNLTDIGIVLSYVYVTQFLMIGILGGSSVIGITSTGKGIRLTEYDVIKIQMIIATTISLLFLIVSNFINDLYVLNFLFFIFILTTAITSYWLVIKQEHFKTLFYINIATKILFLLMFVILIKLKPFDDTIVYTVSIVLEYFLMNMLLMYLDNKFVYFKIAFHNKISLEMITSYLSASFSELLKSFKKDIDKLLVVFLLPPNLIAVYNIIFKLIDIPSNLIMQYNYLHLKHKKIDLNVIYGSIAISIVAIFALLGFYDLVLDYLVSEKIHQVVMEYKIIFYLFSVLIIIRPLNQFLDFNYYHHGLFNKLTKYMIVYIVIILFVGFITVSSLNAVMFLVAISELIYIVYLYLKIKKGLIYV